MSTNKEMDKLREALAGDDIFRQASAEELEARGAVWPPFIEIKQDLWLDARGMLVDSLGDPVLREGDILELANVIAGHRGEYRNDMSGEFWFNPGQKNWFNALQEDPYDEPANEAVSPKMFKPASEEEIKNRKPFEYEFRALLNRLRLDGADEELAEGFHDLWQMWFPENTATVQLPPDPPSLDEVDSLVWNLLQEDPKSYSFADLQFLSANLGRPIHIEEY